MSNETNAAAVAEAIEIKFKDDLLGVSGEFRPQFTTDAATGTVTLPPGLVFNSGIAKEFDVTEESYIKHRKFTDLLNNGLTHAGTEVAVELFKGNKDLQTVTVKAPLTDKLKDSYEGVFNRKGTSRNPSTGEVSNYVGAIGVGRINVVSSRPQVESKNIKQNFRNMADLAGLE